MLEFSIRKAWKQVSHSYVTCIHQGYKFSNVERISMCVIEKVDKEDPQPKEEISALRKVCILLYY